MRFYCLRTVVSGLSSATSINGAELVADLKGGGVSFTLTINEWILPGENELHLFLRWPEQVPFEPGSAEAESTVFIQDGFAVPDAPQRILAHLAWPLPGVPEGYPVRPSIRFRVEDPPPVNLWKEARPTEVTEADADQIRALVETFHAAAVARDADRMLALSQYKFRDKAIADGHAEAVMNASALRGFSQFLGAEDTVVHPIDVPRLMFVPVADRRAFRVLLDGVPKPIVAEDVNSVRRIDLYVARVHDNWTIVR